MWDKDLMLLFWRIRDVAYWSYQMVAWCTSTLNPNRCCWQAHERNLGVAIIRKVILGICCKNRHLKTVDHVTWQLFECPNPFLLYRLLAFIRATKHLRICVEIIPYTIKRLRENFCSFRGFLLTTNVLLLKILWLCN